MGPRKIMGCRKCTGCPLVHCLGRGKDVGHHGGQREGMLVSWVGWKREVLWNCHGHHYGFGVVNGVINIVVGVRVMWVRVVRVVWFGAINSVVGVLRAKGIERDIASVPRSVVAEERAAKS
jgi:hypothetical protein